MLFECIGARLMSGRHPVVDVPPVVWRNRVRIDADGRVYRQVYGIRFPTPQLIEPLKQLVFGEPQEQSSLSYLGNRIRLFCTVYDPATDSYRIDISVFIGTIVGVIVSILFGYVLLKEWRKSIRADQ